MANLAHYRGPQMWPLTQCKDHTYAAERQGGGHTYAVTFHYSLLEVGNKPSEHDQTILYLLFTIIKGYISPLEYDKCTTAFL